MANLRQKPVSCPSGKRCWSAGKAQGVIENARRSSGQSRQEQRAYFCHRCGCWHTTKEEYRFQGPRTDYRANL